MKISELWLREWVNPPKNSNELAAQLTLAGLEVDAVMPVAGEFTKVIVAQIIETSQHPQADRLQICKVNTGSSEPLQIVCGAQNARPGLKVALALSGATLPGGFNIKESKLRGELSQGMLCSEAELGLAETSEGILELPVDAPLGKDLREYLLLNDQIIDIDLTPNRADCLSVLGIAREIAALNNLSLVTNDIDAIDHTIQDTLEVHLSNPNACPHYCGRIIRKINSHAQTPVWMKEKLRRSGIRTRHPVVDVTNYVMLELGQPMHAFNLNAIEGPIKVRLASEDEKITLLTGQEITVNSKTLMIADKTRAIAVAGIMGGLDSSVQEDTTDIFIESAYFNPLQISGVARAFGLTSDSSQRFERGVDPALQKRALERVTQLLQSIVGGEVGPIIEITHADSLPKIPEILFHPQKVKQLTGIELAEDHMLDLLKRLDMQITATSIPWIIKPPSYRFDLTLEVDLVEEIIRLYGYDKIPAKYDFSPIQINSGNLKEELLKKIKTLISALGFHETISYSFVDPEFQSMLFVDTEFMQLLNPISSELSQMRISLWPGLLQSMIYNLHRQQSCLKLFETGVIFQVKEKEINEQLSIAGLLTGVVGDLNWSESKRELDFYDIKGDLESLLVNLGLKNFSFVPNTHPALHPGQAAQIIVDNKVIGWIGAIHPQIIDALDIESNVYVFEILLHNLLTESKAIYKAISKYPQIRRDLSFFIDEEITFEQISQAVHKTIPKEYLKAFDVFDVYQGETIPKGKKSFAIALTLQNNNHTLVDTEINDIINSTVKQLEEKFAIELRSA